MIDTVRRKAHIIQLLPTREQEQYFRRAAGIRRFAYNWGLEWRNKQWETHKAECADCGSGDAELRKSCKSKPKNNEAWMAWGVYKKAARDEKPWLYEVSATVAKWAIVEDLKRAFNNWWNKKIPAGHPVFKSRKSGLAFVAADSLPLAHAPVKARKTIRLTTIGWVRCREAVRWKITEDVRIKRVTVREKAGKWYAVLLFEESGFTPPVHENQVGVVGVDLGSRKLAATYDGVEHRTYENPAPLKGALRRLRRWNRKLARRGKRDNKGRVLERTIGFRKASARVARIGKRVADIRAYHQNDLTNELTRKYGVVGTEDLHVKGMIKGRNARALADVGMGEILRQIAYKTEWRGGVHVQVDRFFPSSKLCADCGTPYQYLGSRERWVCPSCGTVHDRDENAAQNIYNKTLEILEQGTLLRGSSPYVMPVEANAGSRRLRHAGEGVADETGTLTDAYEGGP